MRRGDRALIRWTGCGIDVYDQPGLDFLQARQSQSLFPQSFGKSRTCQLIARTLESFQDARVNSIRGPVALPGEGSRRDAYQPQRRLHGQPRLTQCLSPLADRLSVGTGSQQQRSLDASSAVSHSIGGHCTTPFVRSRVRIRHCCHRQP